MAALPVFGEAHLQRICDVLGDTGSGLTGTEIGRLLRQVSVADPEPSLTKRYRLFAALSQRQVQDRCGNLVAAFIQEAMVPVRYTGASELFERRLSDLNKCSHSAGAPWAKTASFDRR